MATPKPWTLPLIVAAIVVPVIAGFALVGPALGLTLGILIGLILIVTASLLRPGDGP